MGLQAFAVASVSLAVCIAEITALQQKMSILVLQFWSISHFAVWMGCR